MVDFILFSFYVVAFAGGFWCGAKFSTFKNLCNAAREKVKSYL